MPLRVLVGSYEEECDPEKYPHGYPVLYVLDGSSHFHYISGLAHSLAMMDKIPRSQSCWFIIFYHLMCTETQHE